MNSLELAQKVHDEPHEWLTEAAVYAVLHNDFAYLQRQWARHAAELTGEAA